MRRIAIAAVVAGTLLLSSSSRAAEPPSDETRRLVELCKLWGQVKLFHPYVWTRGVDWDAALVAALPKVRGARSEDEYAAAVGGMLAVLGDPATHVAPAPPPTPTAAQKTTPLTEWVQPGVLLVRLTGKMTPTTAKEAGDELAKAGSVIFDLRFSDPWQSWGSSWIQKALFGKLAYRDLRVPPMRFVMHSGYRAQTFTGSGGYFSAFQERSAERIPASPGATRRRAAFLVNAASGVPDQALALQAAGDAVIVTHGVGFDELTVANSEAIALGDKHRVVLRVAELEPLGAVAPHADVELPAEAGDDAVLKAALARLKVPPPKGRPLPPLPPIDWRPEKTYAEMKAPDVEHRLLALFRLWNVIDRFYPYKPLLDEKWDAVLSAFVPRLIAADGQKGYAEVMGELATHIEDTHVHMNGIAEALGLGSTAPRVGMRMIEHQPTVVYVDPAEHDLHVGDVIVTVDGEPFAARLARVRRFVAASNETGRDFAALRYAMAGAPDSTAKLTVRDARGATREVAVPRPRPTQRPHWRGGDVVRILDGNVGYVDLDRLERGEVDAMFDKLMHTRAIIFDMRGYPNGTAWSIAPRLNVRGAELAAAFQRAYVSAEPLEGPARFQFLQRLPENEGGKPLYRGKTFMLVDERTISQAEHTGLFFEAAAGTKFVGSQTAGANGDVTDVTLPGELDLTFTGHDVRHADGRQLQRVGLPIDVPVTPTLAGLRAGRDEVLERALELARK